MSDLIPHIMVNVIQWTFSYWQKWLLVRIMHTCRIQETYWWRRFWSRAS